MKKLYPYLLLAVSYVVAMGLATRRDMWPWIVTYWTILTLKNLEDTRKE